MKHRRAGLENDMSSSAIVARTRATGIEYLRRDGNAVSWSQRPQFAVRFANVREATRAAMRLPSRLRAYALPAPGCELGWLALG
jgi:hypothetical protein